MDWLQTLYEGPFHMAVIEGYMQGSNFAVYDNVNLVGASSWFFLKPIAKTPTFSVIESFMLTKTDKNIVKQ